MATRKSPALTEKKPATRKAPARKTAAAVEAAPVAEKSTDKHTPIHHTPSHEQIALLAVQLWIERGSPYGSPEIDWFRAEETLHAA